MIVKKTENSYRFFKKSLDFFKTKPFFIKIEQTQPYDMIV
jgi:hypothetical protein